MNRYRIPLQRWVNANDIVPMNPPDILPFFYAHVGVTNHIRPDGTIRLNDQEYKGFGGSGSAHHTPLYCQRIYARLPADVKAKMPAPPSAGQ